MPYKKDRDQKDIAMHLKTETIKQIKRMCEEERWDRFFDRLESFKDMAKHEDLLSDLASIMIFELDLDKTKRDVVMVTQPIEEIERLIKEDKQYQILSLKAELMDFELVVDCPFDKGYGIKE